MNNYTIYCTNEQTKKAFELGAPIRTVKSIRTKDTILSDDVIEYDENTFTYVVSPTAEQMIGWLEEKLQEIYVSHISDGWYYSLIITTYEVIPFSIGQKTFKTRKDATLAAIDAALNYLKNHN